MAYSKLTKHTLRMWLPQTAVAVDHFHLSPPRATPARRRQLSCTAAHRLEEVFAVGGPNRGSPSGLDGQETAQMLTQSATAHRFARGRRGGEESTRGPGQGSPTTGDEQALPNRVPVVERDRAADHYGRDGQVGGQQHFDQEHQAHRPRKPQRRQLQIGCSLDRCRPDRGMTLISENYFRAFADERGWGGLPPLFFVAPGGPANPGSFSSRVRKKCCTI